MALIDVLGLPVAYDSTPADSYRNRYDVQEAGRTSSVWLLQTSGREP
jgi:hypothetical protein